MKKKIAVLLAALLLLTLAAACGPNEEDVSPNPSANPSSAPPEPSTQPGPTDAPTPQPLPSIAPPDEVYSFPDLDGFQKIVEDMFVHYQGVDSEHEQIAVSILATVTAEQELSDIRSEVFDDISRERLEQNMPGFRDEDVKFIDVAGGKALEATCILEAGPDDVDPDDLIQRMLLLPAENEIIIATLSAMSRSQTLLDATYEELISEIKPGR
ncbi:MAG: hypothetical protein LBC26_01265 [Oscillospiraceae bacterium]|jgi:hypothetical protein|nr:hypothetical protein [Oscillospiraceae bacterium]